jgi:hypothetical protein
MSLVLGNPITLTNAELSSLCKVGSEIELLLTLRTYSPLKLLILHFHPNLHPGNKPIVCDLDKIFNLCFCRIKPYHSHNTKSK